MWDDSVKMTSALAFLSSFIKLFPHSSELKRLLEISHAHKFPSECFTSH